MASAKKKATLGYRMISLLDAKFDELDRDNNGSLSLDELFALSDTGKDDAQRIMEHFDMNGDAEIEKEEFKHVGLILLSNQKFQQCDVNGDGQLSVDEFKNAMLQLNYEAPQIEKIFKRADTDRSGVIDRMEFLSALLHMISDNDAALDLGSAWSTEKIEQATQGLQVSLEPHFGPLPEGSDGAKSVTLADLGEIEIDTESLINVKIPIKVRLEGQEVIKLIPLELSLPLKITANQMGDEKTNQWKKVYKLLM
jgi:Ca2+-binding EF-hand superfamily protein